MQHAQNLEANMPPEKRWFHRATVCQVVQHHQLKAGLWWCCVELMDGRTVWLPETWFMPATPDELREAMRHAASSLAPDLLLGPTIMAGDQSFKTRFAEQADDEPNGTPPLWLRCKYLLGCVDDPNKSS
ncbi:MAG: hypothetical protein SNJ50_04160 [Cyanobacteriota bacterium]